MNKATALLKSSTFIIPEIGREELVGEAGNTFAAEAMSLYHRGMVRQMGSAYPFDPERNKLQAIVRRHQRGAQADVHATAIRKSFQTIMASHAKGTHLPLNRDFAEPLALSAINSLLGLQLTIKDMGEAHLVGVNPMIVNLSPRDIMQGWSSHGPVKSAVKTALGTGSYSDDGLLAALVRFASDNDRSQEFVVMSATLLLVTGSTLNRSVQPLLRLLLSNPRYRLAVVEGDSNAVFDELLRLHPPFKELCRYDPDRSSPGKKCFTTVDAVQVNRDPAHFPKADEFDPQANRKPTLTFGLGPHACDGKPLTRVFLRETVLPLLTRTKGLRLVETEAGKPTSIVYDRFE